MYWRGVTNRRYPLHKFDIVTIPVGIIGSVGLIIYAFTLPPISPGFWRWFLPVFAVSEAWEITAAIKDEAIDVGAIVGATLGIMILGLMCVAIFRIGF